MLMDVSACSVPAPCPHPDNGSVTVTKLLAVQTKNVIVARLDQAPISHARADPTHGIRVVRVQIRFSFAALEPD